MKSRADVLKLARAAKSEKSLQRSKADVVAAEENTRHIVSAAKVRVAAPRIRRGKAVGKTPTRRKSRAKFPGRKFLINGR